MIMGFHEYTFQDCEYIIRAMATKHAQCTCLAATILYAVLSLPFCFLVNY